MIPRQSRGIFVCGHIPGFTACAFADAGRSANCIGLLLAARKRVIIAFAKHCHLFPHLVFIQLVFNVFCNCLCISASFHSHRSLIIVLIACFFSHRQKPFFEPPDDPGVTLHKKPAQGKRQCFIIDFPVGHSGDFLYSIRLQAAAQVFQRVDHHDAIRGDPLHNEQHDIFRQGHAAAGVGLGGAEAMQKDG